MPEAALPVSNEPAPHDGDGAGDGAGRGYYKDHMGDLAHRLKLAVPTDVLRELHHRSALRHGLIAARQFAMLFGLGWVCVRYDNPWIWLPAAALQGIVVLSFIILLHDVIHGTVFQHRRAGWDRALSLLYAAPSAIAASQFKRWHLDHHDELGSATEDPKRAHLSPKRNARWLKFLYMTPGLFVIYAKAAATAAKRYPPELRRVIALERLGNVVLHLSVIAAIWHFADGAAVVRAWLVPIFGFFPAAFTVNRLGQHYWVDKTDPAKWGTRVDGNPVLNFLFLQSNHHIEHHYFPRVPLYRLPALNHRLRPFWDGIGHPSRSYPRLLWKWFVENRAPHTNWD
ncbi:MAG: fatty acid desaturase [Planctomycetes bacterium]|nr:fatty acid desaturase [Planctomycetota bacterium]